MKNLVLIGGGGHALSLLDILSPDVTVTGYVDVSPSPMMPVEYLGNDDEFLSSLADDNNSHCAVAITCVSGRDCSLYLRGKLLSRYHKLLPRPIIAPTAIVSPSARLADGVQVFHRAVISASTTIGQGSIVNTGAIVEHGCTIGRNIFIGPGAVICGGVTIGDGSYIGAGVIIKPGVKIAPDTVIGLGATVIHDITAAGIYAGNPATRIR